MTYPTITQLLPMSLDGEGSYPSVLTSTTEAAGEKERVEIRSPIDGLAIATFRHSSDVQFDLVAKQATEAFQQFRILPAPLRGEFVRRIGEKLRLNKDELAALITWEAGKITQESLGEVQEMIDVCDFAVGLSRQLHGLTIVSERPDHRMMEQWQPIGPVGVISAFNFPMAVWAWNAMLAFVCGNPVVWKPSDQTALCALACQRLVLEVLEFMPEIPQNISAVILGNGGKQMVDDGRFPLISATGSTAMGRTVGTKVARRLGKSLLELGGNNAMVVSDSADLGLAVRGIVFSAVGTAGQRCTTLRRLFVQENVSEELVGNLTAAYQTLPIGDPRAEGILLGPLVNRASYESMQEAIVMAIEQGGSLLCGGERFEVPGLEDGYFVKPAILSMPGNTDIVRKETFAPILYVVTYKTLEEAIALQNDVPQGLSSAIFTNDIRESEQFIGAAGSDCGIANVNIGTSGAEIGGAFGGEKDTGGGRESGSDAWKNYMRRTTNTINFGTDLPLAQGIDFGG